MKVIEKNVITGVVTERSYTQKELDDIAEANARELPQRQIREKREDIATKREAAIEEILMAGTSAKAVAYQNAKNAP